MSDCEGRAVEAGRDLGWEALREQLSALYPRLRRFAAVVGPRDVEPDDLVQQALLAALSRHRLDEIDEPLAYLRQTILNLASNERRRAGRSHAALNRLRAAVSESAFDRYESDIEELFGLAPTTRAVIYLHHIEGEPFAAVADALGLSEENARTIASRGRRELQRQHRAERS